MERKIELFVDHMMDEYNIHPSCSYPYSFRLLSRMGLSIRPPIFRSFIANALTWGIPFAMIWILLVSIFNSIECKEMHFPVILSFGMLGGSIYGLIQAVGYARLARRLHLPIWDKYDSSRNN